MKQMLSAALALPLMLGGCSASYMPLAAEDYVSITIHTGNGAAIGSEDGGPYRAIIEMCIAKDSDPRACGRRIVPAEYDEDTFEVDSDMYGSYEMECIGPTIEEGAWTSHGIKESSCAARVPEAKPGWEFRFTVNELTGSAVTMPAISPPTSPAANSEISVSAIDSIEMAWEPSSEGAALEWEIFYSFYEVPEGCGEEAGWGDVDSGAIEDTGAFTLAKDLLPTNLPPGGCPVNLTLIRTRMGRFDPGIKAGELVARQFGSTRVTLKP